MRRALDHHSAGAGRRGTRTTTPIGRRAAIGILAGLGAASLALAWPLGRTEPDGQSARAFPAWVYTMPRGGEAYAAAFSDLDLMDTVPCFCGCMEFKTDPHKSLRTCFEQQSGEIEPHGAFCETCQGEAIDAIALQRQGVPRAEIRERIIVAYGPAEH
jgi:hypothetical protein